MPESRETCDNCEPSTKKVAIINIVQVEFCLSEPKITLSHCRSSHERKRCQL
jgi:hypothetical protein